MQIKANFRKSRRPGLCESYRARLGSETLVINKGYIDEEHIQILELSNQMEEI